MGSYADWLRKKREEDGLHTGAMKAKTDAESGSYADWLRKKREAGDDIAPVATITLGDVEKEQEKKNTWFTKGLFEDGYQFGDVTRTILGTVGDVGANLVQGVGNLVEGATDLLIYGGAAINDVLGADDAAAAMREAAKKNTVNDTFAPVNDFLDKRSVLGEKSDTVAQGLGQVGAIIGTGGLLGAAGFGSTAITAATTGMIGVSGTGSGMSEAYQNGATDDEAAVYGLINGVAEAGSELIFGGLGKTVKAVGLSKGLSSLDDVFAQKISSKITNQVAKNFVEFGVKASAEGAEEVLSGIGSAVGKKLTYMSEEELSQIIEDEDLLDQFIMGTVTSGFAQSGLVPGMTRGSLKEANKTEIDFISGLNQNEQAVVEREYENRLKEAEADGKISKKEKSKIYDQVLRDMEKGYISTDTIESVLGGKTADRYKTLLDRETSLKEQEDALKAEIETLLDKANPTIRDTERLAEARKELAVTQETLSNLDISTAKTQLSNKVSGLVRGSRLAESYDERGRKSQTFEADLAKYNDKQQEIIKKAIDSGILNNTNRTHEFVDMVAKISADKGVSFDFTNNAKLKESGFVIDGKSVNGYVTKDGVTLNIQSAKSLNSVVGHEITHVLEGTELYTELQNAIVEYAKTKGEYQGRYDTITELYKNIEGVDIDAELTADLVGDYLFTDQDFINNLSANNRNVFQKIYDEIKYLCKVATAGSKEARELEKVKRAFDEAYKEGGKAIETTKYSFVGKDADGVEIYETSKETKKLTGKEKNKHVIELMQNEFKGRTAKFTTDSQTYYAQFDKAALQKGLYGDRKSTNAGKIAKANIAADGNYIELVENSTYSGSSTEQGKTNRNHKNVTDWDYFVKEIACDGVYYDVLVNVRKTNSGEYVYDVNLWENANKKDVAPQRASNDNNRPTLLFGDATSKNIIPYKSENGKDSLSEEGEQLAPIGRYNVYGKDIALENTESALTTSVPEDIAPVKNTVLEEERKQWQEVKAKAEEARQAGKTESEQIAEILDSEPDTKAKSIKRSWAKFKAALLDKGAVFEDLALRVKNRELMSKWNYILSSEARAQRLIGNGAVGMKSLNAIREEVGGEAKLFENYMYHRHNIDRMSLGEGKNKPVFGNSVTADVSREKVKKYEAQYPQFTDYAEYVYRYMNYLRNMMVENGIISQETANLWVEMYPHYVPIGRVKEDGSVNVSPKTNKIAVNAPVKWAKGGDGEMDGLFDTIGKRTIQTYKAIAKNNFGMELKNTLDSVVARAYIGDINMDGLLLDIINIEEGLLQQGENGQLPTFTVFDGGERVTFAITEDMYDALKPVSEKWAKTYRPLAAINNFRRGLLTEYNPVFILTNGIKDFQDVLINSRHAAKTYAKIPEAFAQMVKKGYWYNEYLNAGGEQNTYFDKETNTFKTQNKGLARVLALPPFSTISALNNFIERVPRLAEYIASREAGESIETAMLDAARVTTNFAAGSDFTKFLNRNGVTFLNASMQGAMQQIRNFREAKANGLKGWVNLATKFAIAGLPSILLNNLVWDDDDEYAELSDYVKQSYYIVGKMEDGTFIRIPKGRALAVIQNGIEQIGNALTGDDEVDLANFLQLAYDNLAPNNPWEENILSPIRQVAENKTWYGEDLVPTRLQDLPDAEQFDESTDSISKWLGEQLNISPVKINYLFDQYSGGIGDVLLPMLTPQAESGDSSLLGKTIAPLKNKFTTDSIMNNQNVADFYETKEELTINANSSKATDEDILKSKYMNSINAELSELYKQKREIQNGNLPDDEKYQAVRDIQEQIVNLARESLESYNDVNVWVDENGVGDSYYATVADKHYRWVQQDDEETGNWEKISDKQLEKQNKVTNALGITPQEYWSNAKEEYDYAYEYPEKYAVAKSVGGYDAWKSYSSELSDIHADKDSNGKSISGSRKEKVIDWINALDADYGTKIILFKSEYTADDTYNNDIISYLNERNDLTFNEKLTILRQIGFTVGIDGRITW